MDNNNWNGILIVNYCLVKIYMLIFNYVLNIFCCFNIFLLVKMELEDVIVKEIYKNIFGLFYWLMLFDNWNFLVFGKYYSLYVVGFMVMIMN